jgi:hypothetical protein
MTAPIHRSDNIRIKPCIRQRNSRAMYTYSLYVLCDRSCGEGKYGLDYRASFVHRTLPLPAVPRTMPKGAVSRVTPAGQE